MPLTQIAKHFPDITYTAPETVVDRPGWLFAQRCEAWWRFDRADPASVLLVYRSVLVTDHKRLYAPVADLLLSANRMEVLGQGRRRDPSMMHGSAEFILVRTTEADQLPSWPAPAHRDALESITDEALSLPRGVLA